ncbi:hypothetical protein L2E82_44745 [Cichorium intybus]|uniref:Uncharacterized protein n=1 Tax=Cichorium intybus TaxID=13427 RepID=A0ACB8ZSD8_CICIN|nr:hypothetical protein L2E82_44745 [Cichorium intybus]
MEIKVGTNVFTVRVKEMEGKVFEQFLNSELNDKEKERKEEGEWEGDDWNWLSDDGESVRSDVEEEVEKTGAWKNSNSGGKFEESFIAESRELVQEGQINNDNKILKQDPLNDIQGGDSPSPKKVDKSGSKPKNLIGKGGEKDIDSDSSMSIGILQRLEEVGKLSGLRKGDEGGDITPR